MKKVKNKKIFGILVMFGVTAALSVSATVSADSVTSGESAYTDVLSVTINKACMFGRGTRVLDDVFGGASHPSGSWLTSESDNTLDILSGSIDAGAIIVDYGSSNFVVVCNNKDGWQVSATAESLVGESNSGEIIALGEPAEDVAAWSYTPTTDDDNVAVGAMNASIVATSGITTPTSGRAFKVQYAVSADHQLSAQTYSGSVIYTFAQLPVVTVTDTSRNGDMEDGGETKNGEPEETKGGGEVKEEPKEESKGGNEESQGGSSEEGSPVGPLMTSVYNNTYSNVYNNYNTTGGTNEGDGGSLASNESGKTVSDAEKLKSGEEKALGVVAKTGGEGKKAEDDNTGWIVLGMTAAVVAAGAATGIYIYKTKEA